ncbi:MULTISPECIES: hypothetical protein [Pseudoalteromonas]|uniref:Uncharacterized protein n=1 Tax=Pseudoalteromonas luteoviolacea (strain 2ta16) TaxID=1353533 RepID=V4HTG8_PSEL2|nr:MULTISPECIES: hypothetical protein [Pseudoalteromonas]ESP93073.1 hypothetical protein PL2TA16_03705 [Pseudoalteromonas luteoviolacea 2ta16]KZN43114.1 hypothetical protein N483_09350 [Pseudoalteromonas luteoviolacea NCIMB 1944]MCG7549509.1 hypothetical protein [Pseudoalteromonas sp. Of7M-16]
MKKTILASSLLFASLNAMANPSGKSIDLVFNCGENFAISAGGKLYLLDSTAFSEAQYNRLYSMAMTMVTTGKAAGNVFTSGGTIRWCGNDVTKITNLSMRR